MSSRVEVIDSHTEGEPTRMVLDGGPALSGRSLAQKATDFEENYSEFRAGLLLEPRGSDAWVGALLVPPSDTTYSTGVIFFNNVGVLGMCGHGTMGVIASLAHLNRLSLGDHVIETPVGNVSARLNVEGSVSVKNVPSYRYRAGVSVNVPGYGTAVGDIAYGGNWFFLSKESAVPILATEIEALTKYAEAIKHALASAGITGADQSQIDHIELFGAPRRSDADSKNFVLCPGDAYDRSPCGTGTSAKLACLAADAVVAPEQVWRQESIIGTLFEASYEHVGERISPTVTGRAFVTAESALLFDDRDPFRNGIRVG